MHVGGGACQDWQTFSPVPEAFWGDVLGLGLDGFSQNPCPSISEPMAERQGQALDD